MPAEDVTKINADLDQQGLPNEMTVLINNQEIITLNELEIQIIVSFSEGKTDPVETGREINMREIKIRKISMNRILILLTVVFSLFFFSCKSDKLYEEYKTIQSSGWEKDSVARFNVTIDKHYLSYNLSINVRNRGDYPYSNLWLFVDITAPDHTKISDTIEYQLALPNGKWIGKGTGGMYSTQFPFRENVSFPSPGNYTISVRHAMRTNSLTGITDIGLAVKKQ